MSAAMLEHVNITVSNPEASAELLCQLFDWKIRWRGPSQLGGRTVHVGSDDTYIAVYSVAEAGVDPAYRMPSGLNHIAVVVHDLDATERRVLDAGLKTMNHADYPPGRRFYFHDRDGIEYEVVSYT